MGGAQAIGSVISHAEGPATGQRVYDLVGAKTLHQYIDPGKPSVITDTPNTLSLTLTHDT